MSRNPIFLLFLVSSPLWADGNDAPRRVTLPEAVRLAEQNNPSMEVVRARLLEAQAQVKAAWAQLVPVARGSLTFTHNDKADIVSFGGGSVVARRQDDLAGGLLVDVPLVNPQAWLYVSQAKLSERITQLSTEQLRQGLLLQVAAAYFQALTAERMIDIYREQIGGVEKHLLVADLHHRSGTGSRLDVLRARSEILASQEQLASAQAGLDNTIKSLSTLCASADRLLPAGEPRFAVEGLSLDLLEQRALSRREDLLMARRSVELAERAVTGSWMRFLPVLSGTWQFSYQITDPSAFRATDKTRWLYFITLSVPIFEEGRYADLDLKRAALMRSRAELENAQQQARLEVQRLWRDWRKAEEQLQLAEQSARVAAETLQLALSAYQNGTGSSLEVTDAQRSQRQAEINLAIRRLETQLQLLTLLRATGEDLSRISDFIQGGVEGL